MKIYLICPKFRSGGPENIHLLCDYINRECNDNVEALMYYSNNGGNYDNIYPNIELVKVAPYIDDKPENIIIIPEVYYVPEYRAAYPKSIMCIWWLSYTNACMNSRLTCNLIPDVIHLFHSYYEYAMLHPLLAGSEYYFMTDYVHDMYLNLNADDYYSQKEDIVCYNGSKDHLTKKICDEMGIPCIMIKNMTSDQVMKSLQSAKVYVDLGFHPGKDHLPREASQCGCVVITNKCGSAAYYEDVPIEEKITYDGDLNGLLEDVLKNYDKYYKKQENYRKIVKDEKEIHNINAKNFISSMRAKTSC